MEYTIGEMANATEENKLTNPNNLSLNKSSYVKGVTRLFVQRNKKLLPAVFDHFETKNGKEVIYVECEGKVSFYAFPQTSYVFSNKDDGTAALSKKKRKHETSADSLRIINAYSKLPTAQKPSRSKPDELEYETKQHKRVDEKLLRDILEQKRQLAAAQDALSAASGDFRKACIEARENGGYFDDHTFISIQMSSSTARAKKASAEKDIYRTESIRNKPYFARVDCGKTVKELHTAYIGDADIPGYVVDWRHPEIGNAYYLSAILQARDDIVIALKRTLDIRHAEFLDYDDEINIYHSDSFRASDEELEDQTDALLTKLLSISREDKTTHDIIKTIQSEQYDIITSDFFKNAVINGCAGSGKTMILYHRLSYIAYNHSFRIGRPFDPQKVYVISPSDYFDASNSALLQKLSIDTIHIGPLDSQIENLICGYCAKYYILPFYSILSLFESTNHGSCEFYREETFRQFLDSVESIDSVPTLKETYTQWITNAAQFLLEENGFETVPGNELSNIDDFFGQLYRSEYFIKKKPDKEDVNAKTEYFLKEAITGISYENIIASLDTLSKTGNTYRSRSKRLAQYKIVLSMCISTHTRRYSNGTIVTDLNDFWNILERPNVFQKISALIIAEKLLRISTNAKYPNQDYLLKCAFVYQNQIPSQYADRAGLYYLKALTCKYGALIKDPSFIFVDEFQNYSVFELQCLKDVFIKPTFNLYGDFDQRIEEKGSELQDALDSVFSPQMYNLNINYRNAKQITKYINKCLYKNMHPIGVDGTVSEIEYFDCEFRKQNRTAIIAKDPELVSSLLQLRFGKGFLAVAAETKTIDSSELMLLSVFECKGLEFDTVYVFSDGMTENEKYVAYTRALDHLIVITDENLGELKKAEEARIRQENAKRKKSKASDQTTDAAQEQKQIGHPQPKEEQFPTEPLTEDQYGAIYWEAIQRFTSDDLDELAHAVSLLEGIADWRDSKTKIAAFNKKIVSIKEAQREHQRAAYRANKRCQHCGGKFKGIFSKICGTCGRKKDY